MNIFFVIIAVVVVFMLYMQIKTLNASHRLTGRPAPAGALNDPRGVIYYFHLPRCGPCRQMGRVIDEVAAAHPEQVVKVNVADDMVLAQAFGITATPTTLLVKDGSIKQVILGVRSARQISTLLD